MTRRRLSRTQLAEQLGVASTTVRTHLRDVVGKTVALLARGPLSLAGVTASHLSR